MPRFQVLCRRITYGCCIGPSSPPASPSAQGPWQSARTCRRLAMSPRGVVPDTARPTCAMRSLGSLPLRLYSLQDFSNQVVMSGVTYPVLADSVWGDGA